MIMSSAKVTARVIESVGVPNFRDVGNGVRVRHGLVYRAADPTKASDEALRIMGNHLGIHIIFDLRSSYEVEKHRPDGTGTNHFEIPFSRFGMRRQWTPVFEYLDFSPDKVPQRYLNYTMPGSEGYVNAYRNILQSATTAFATIFRYLAQSHPAPCVVHCTVGKDRTGVLVALLLMLAGESKEDIGTEYSLTDAGLAKVKPVYVERLMERDEFKNNEEGAWRLLSSKKENMEATVDMIWEEFGGPVIYMTEHCSMTEEEVEQLRLNLLVQSSIPKITEMVS